MSNFIKITARIDNTIKHILNGLLVFLVLDVCWQVLTRFVLPEPSSYTEEIARFLLIWIGLLGAAHAYRQSMHLGIDFFVGKLSAPTQKQVRISVLFFCAIFAIAVLLIGGTNLVLITLQLQQKSAALGIKMGYVYTVLPITGILILLYTAELLLATLRGEAINFSDESVTSSENINNTSENSNNTQDDKIN